MAEETLIAKQPEIRSEHETVVTTGIGGETGVLRTGIDPAGAELRSEFKLSKNQQKRLKRRQQWEEDRPARKALRKEKRYKAKERKREKIQSGELEAKPTKQANEKAIQVPLTILIDCQFEDLMTPEELVSMSTQVTRCYSDHRKAKYKPSLAVSSFKGGIKDRFEGILNNQHQSWDVHFHESHFTEVATEAKEWMAGSDGGDIAGALSNDVIETHGENPAVHPPAGEVIYLTSDSPDTLERLKPYSTYIVGGIVDKNRHKGICYQRARDHNIKTAKLPISEHLKLSSRQVLTTNHVHEILLRWLESGDWGEAFMAVIPQRKGGELKSVQSEPDERASTFLDNVRSEGFKHAASSDIIPSHDVETDNADPVDITGEETSVETK